MDTLAPTIIQDLISGFRTCGIYPKDKAELIKKKPDQKSSVNPELVGQVFIDQLNNKRGHATGIKITKKKKLNIPPGKGITPDDI